MSLHEANDVARRIGETYQGQRYGWKGFEGAWTRRRAHRGMAEHLPDEEEVAVEEQAADWLSSRMFGLRLSAWEDPKK